MNMGILKATRPHLMAAWSGLLGQTLFPLACFGQICTFLFYRVSRSSGQGDDVLDVFIVWLY